MDINLPIMQVIVAFNLEEIFQLVCYNTDLEFLTNLNSNNVFLCEEYVFYFLLTSVSYFLESIESLFSL